VPAQGAEQYDLTSLKAETPEIAQAQNREVLRKLDQLQIAPNPRRTSALPVENLGDVFEALEKNPVTSKEGIRKYDRDDLGMCFGRAMAVHLDLLRRGVQKESIKKLWAVGDIARGNQRFQYHVATTVKATDGKWYVFDPVFFKEPVKADEWVHGLEGWDRSGKLIVFMTEPERFNPRSPKKYDPQVLMKRDFKGFFSDLLKSFRESLRRP
jgi:hypothetical protein